MLASASSEDDAQNVGITLMQGIATGSLLYVVFFEVIEKERAGRTSHAVQLIFIVLGSATIVALKVILEISALHNSTIILDYRSLKMFLVKMMKLFQLKMDFQMMCLLHHLYHQ